MSHWEFRERGYVSESNTISTSDGLGRSCRRSIENLRDRHAARAMELHHILQGDGPEIAEQRIARELAEDHPDGKRCHAGCSHSTDVVAMPRRIPREQSALPAPIADAAPVGFFQRLMSWVQL